MQKRYAVFGAPLFLLLFFATAVIAADYVLQCLKDTDSFIRKKSVFTIGTTAKIKGTSNEVP